MSESLIWMDLEMTGLDSERDVIIEIATIVTDADLNLIAKGPRFAIHREASWFAKMDSWNQEHHTKSGLWQEVLTSQVTEKEAEKQTLEFIKKYSTAKASPLCGNSIWQDRRFLAKYMRELDDFLHYRLIDVSTVKELVKRWMPDAPKQPEKEKRHRAYDDILESIDELKFYRSLLFK